MVRVRSGWIEFPVLELRPDSSIVLLIQWGTITVDMFKMLALAAHLVLIGVADPNLVYYSLIAMFPIQIVRGILHLNSAL